MQTVLTAMPTSFRSLMKSWAIDRELVERREVAHLFAEDSRKAMRGRTCPRCKELCWDIFVVHDAVWGLIRPEWDKLHLHPWCLEEEIGRPLLVEDLKPIPGNDYLFYFLKGKRP